MAEPIEHLGHQMRATVSRSVRDTRNLVVHDFSVNWEAEPQHPAALFEVVAKWLRDNPLPDDAILYQVEGSYHQLSLTISKPTEPVEAKAPAF